MRRIGLLTVLAVVAGSAYGAIGTRAHIRPSLGTHVAQEQPRYTVLTFPFAQTGVVATDASTLANVAFTGSALSDSYNAWTMNGTVPQNVSSPLYPNGFASARARGAGPFTDANYYSLGTGSDPLDVSGDFSACVAYDGTDQTANHVLVGDGLFQTDGWYLQNGTAAVCQLVLSNGGAVNTYSAATANAAVSKAPNVCCFGMTGTTMMVKLNNGTTATAVTAGARTPATTRPAVLGRYNGAGLPYAGAIWNFWFSTTTPSDALFSRVMARYYGTLADDGLTYVTTTSSMTPFVTHDREMWNAPANVARVFCEDPAHTKCGLIVENTRSNPLAFSTDCNNPAWGRNAGVVTTGQFCTGPSGTTYCRVDNTASGAGTGVYQGWAATYAGPYTINAWIQSDAGTKAASLWGFCNVGQTASACSCTRTDGVACTATASTRFCEANNLSVDTLGVRVNVTFTCSGTGSPGILLMPGNGTSTTGTMCYGDANFEYDATSPNKAAWGTQFAGARGAEVHSIATNPLLGLQTYCIEATYTPEMGRAWGFTWPLWMFTTYLSATTNVTLAGENLGAIDWQIYDSSNVLKTNSAAHAFAAGSSHKIGHSMNQGTATLYFDGVAQTTTTAGAGSNLIQPHQSPFYVGSHGNATGQGYRVFNGFISGLRFKHATCY